MIMVESYLETLPKFSAFEKEKRNTVHKTFNLLLLVKDFILQLAFFFVCSSFKYFIPKKN